MIAYLKEHKPHHELWLRTGSGKIFQAKIIYPKSDGNELIPHSVFRCEHCPPKLMFKSGNCKYRFKKNDEFIEVYERSIHIMESHPDKIPRPWLDTINAFFRSAKL